MIFSDNDIFISIIEKVILKLKYYNQKKFISYWTAKITATTTTNNNKATYFTDIQGFYPHNYCYFNFLKNLNLKFDFRFEGVFPIFPLPYLH